MSLAAFKMSRRRFVRDSDIKIPVDASLAFALNTFRATSLLENLTMIGATLVELSSVCGVSYSGGDGTH